MTVENMVEKTTNTSNFTLDTKGPVFISQVINYGACVFVRVKSTTVLGSLSDRGDGGGTLCRIQFGLRCWGDN